MNLEKIIANAQKSVENLNVFSPRYLILASFKTKGFSSVIS